MFGPEYHKINTVFKRDARGVIVPDDYSLEEFKYLRDCTWRWTEKIDGTNIRITFTPATEDTPFHYHQTAVGGRTDNAQIPAFLLSALEQFRDTDLFMDTFPEAVESGAQVVLYGEGYGAKIQKGGGNYRPDQGFILFDVRVGRWWLKREDVKDVAQKMGMDTVPLMGHWSLDQAVAQVRATTKQKRAGIPPEQRLMCSHWPNVEMEGIVGTPSVDLFDRRGERIIAKLKVKDFEQYLKENDVQ